MGNDGRVTGTYGPFGGHHALAELAAGQHVVFSAEQVGALGISGSALRKRAAAGALHRVHRAVYSLVPPGLLTRKGHYMAAVLACGPGAVLSHRDAAHLHEIRATHRSKIDVTIPRRATLSHEGIDIHRSTTLTDADVTTIDGVPCTALARTILDLAGVVGEREVERAMEQAEMLGALDARALDDQLERNLNAHAAGCLRRALAAYQPGQAPTESEFEERMLALCRGIGVPVPRRQFYVDPGDGEPLVRLDFAWPEHRYAVETDGRRYHGTAGRFEADRRKDQRLMLAGWRVSRITWRQLRDEPERIARLVLQELTLR
jgi:predicted transcriptional regulator of viral defense system